jgi:ArsR family transcriptional regulator
MIDRQQLVDTMYAKMEASNQKSHRTLPIRHAADLFQVLSHPARLRILDELRRAEACVCHLQAVLGRPQAYVSQQLRVLREADLVADRREGQLVYYRVDQALVRVLLEQVLGPPGAPSHPPTCPCPSCQGGTDPPCCTD